MPKIYYQLYSGRNYGDLQALVTDISKIGFAGVEPYGAFYADHLQSLQNQLATTKMHCSSGHVNLDDVLNQPEKIIALAKSLSMRTVVIPFVPVDVRPKTAKEWKELATKIENIAPEYAKHNIELGYHNHDFEFEICDGEFAMDILLQNAPSLLWEVDAAWIKRANQDPIAWMQKYQSRINLVHVKDIAPKGEKEDEGGWADAGTGIMNWSHIFETLGTDFVDIWVLEHDNPSDIIRHAKSSYEFVNKIFNS